MLLELLVLLLLPMFANAADIGSFFFFDILGALKWFLSSDVQSPLEPSVSVVSRYTVQVGRVSADLMSYFHL